MKNLKSIRAFDTIGSIAIMNFHRGVKQNEKKKFALNLLKKNKTIKTVLEKSGKIKGRLRKPITKFLAGEKTKEVLYKETGCVFRFNIDEAYFSPRLSNERKEIASKIGKGDNVLVMFSGVCPYGIIIAKNSQAGRIVCVEINRQANKYARLNVELNKLKDKVEIIQSDIKKIARKFAKEKRKFSIIIMPRPQLKETFLKEAFLVSKKGTRIFYYDFGRQEEKTEIITKIIAEAKLSKKKIKIIDIKKAGEIGPYRFRWRVEMRVL